MKSLHCWSMRGIFPFKIPCWVVDNVTRYWCYDNTGERNKFTKIIDYDSPGVWKVPGGVYERSDANLTPISMVRMNFTVSDFLWEGAFFRILLMILLEY